MPEEREIIVKQQDGDEFALRHNGTVALHGDREEDALQHQFAGEVIHTTPKPLVHMICWEEEQACVVDVKGKVTLVGDKDEPVEVNVRHHFENVHEQKLSIEPVDHSLKVDTKLADPIHHALQLRTPLRVQFCNPWHVASDYVVQVNAGDRSLFSIRLTGATVATPQPCEDDANCPPPTQSHPGHP